MTYRTVTALYDFFDDAARTVRDLEAARVPAENISVVANITDYHRPATGSAAEVDAPSGAGAGASIGAVLGGGVGLLAGLGALAIPGIGPVVAAGWLLSTLAGAAAGASVGAATGGIAAAATGGIVAAMTEAGVSHEHAHVFAEGVRRGGTLVTVRIEAAGVEAVEHIMRQHHAIDPAKRGAAYQRTGWKSFDETRPVFAAEEIERERQRAVRDHAA